MPSEADPNRPRHPRKRRQRPALKWVYAVQVCDHEACWTLHLFDSQPKAEQFCARYRLNARRGEQSVRWYRQRVF